MRIKSLQLYGFKSFVDRTVFSFQDGVTAVVGPNGCGKSNVVDAVRWVMGEQSPRRLRGKGMDDVIFQGSDSRPPIGMAEVEITFDNGTGQGPPSYSAYSEIQLARRLYRSGESEYLINKVPCRLREVQDFFRDSGIGAKGYTIVEQGRIAEIVSAKPEERRVLIEEAAGISKYKARRREAESKIASTEQNLVRVSDVLSEIRRQIVSLERQARKASRYKRTHESLRVLELSLAADERRDLLSQVDLATRKLSELRDRATGLETKLAQRELSLEEQRLALVELEKSVAAGAERLYRVGSEIRHLEGQIELSRREREGLAEANEGRREELAQLREQLRGAEADAVQAHGEIEQLDQALEGEVASISAAEEEGGRAADGLRALERERDDTNDAFVNVLTSVARCEDRLAAVDDRRAEIDQRLRSTDRDLEAQQSEAHQADRAQDHLEEGLRNLLADRDRLQELLIHAMRDYERQVQETRTASELLRELRERHEARKARLESLREVIERREDVAAGTRHILDQGASVRQQFGVRGLVRDCLQVEPEFELAVEAVLAERAEALVVDRAEGAVDALAALRRAEAGQGVFLVERSPEAGAVGIVPFGQPILERTHARPGFEAVARTLLSDVNVVADLSEVLRVYGSGRLPATFVTPQGDVLSPDGVIRGGGEVARRGVLGRVRAVRDLEREVELQSAEVARAEAAQNDAERRLSTAGEELDNLRNRHHTAALAVANHEKDLERTRERVKALGEVQQGRASERAELLEESEWLVEERERLERTLEEQRSDRGGRQRALEALGLRVSSASRELNRLENRVTELRVAHESRAANRDRLAEIATRADQAMGEIRQWIDRRERGISEATDRSEALNEQINQAEAGLALKLDEEEQARVAGEQQREGFDRHVAVSRETEVEVRELRAELSARRDEAASAELTVRESELRLRHLDDAVREKWTVELSSWQLPSVDEVDAAPTTTSDAGEPGLESIEEPEPGESDPTTLLREARKNAELARLPRDQRELQVEAFRSKIQGLGDVNLGAIEEHEELAERARFLAEQKLDLERTIQSLREAISRINRTSRRRFRETFEQVSKCFSENFPRLFAGGKASLMLTEASDVLEAGIDIMAQPPGKRLQNVNLLSGGEKTMTAIALLVAVFQVRPSPFFLLDEVDAALDDANIGRFNQLITELSRDSQFLVITHNKHTIEVADVLYGVTMEQKGVSKLVSVALH